MRYTKSWDEFGHDLKKLVNMMGDYRPDIIVPMLVGGSVPGGILSEMLGVRYVRPIDVTRKDDKREIIFPVNGEIASDLHGLNLLLLDDDAPTGLGIEHCANLYQEKGAIVKKAAVYVNSKSHHLVDFYGEKRDPLPNMPWKPARSGDRIITQPTPVPETLHIIQVRDLKHLLRQEYGFHAVRT